MNVPVDPLGNAIRTRPDVIAVLDPMEEVHLSYRELDERVSRIASGLARAGIGVGDRVGIIGGIDHSTVEAIHGCMRVGASPVPVDRGIGPERRRARMKLVDVAHVISAVDAGEGQPVSALLEHEPVAIRAPRRSEDESVVLFTSGTTGQSAPVGLTWQNLRASAIASALRLGHTPSDRWLVCLPPHTMGGFAPIVRGTIYGTGIVLSPPQAPAVDRSIRNDGPTGISVVPTLLDRFLESGVPLDHLGTVLVGGDRTPADLVERAQAAGVSLFPTYGMTETASQIATATPADLADRSDTVGRPLRWVRVSIESASGERQPVGDRGEIVVRGPTVATGYLDGKGGDRFTLDGGIRTGDEGYLDREGRLFVTGRVTERIVTGGTTVDPRTVADILRTHDEVRAAAVVGLPDERWGERVGALLESAADVDADIVLEDVESHLSSAELPRIAAIVEDLPRTDSGTINKPAVRRYLQSRADGSE